MIAYTSFDSAADCAMPKMNVSSVVRNHVHLRAHESLKLDLRPLTFKLKKQTEQALGINEEFGLNLAYFSLVCKLKPKPRYVA